MAEDLKAILEQQNSEYRDMYGFSDDIDYDFKTDKGLSEKIVREISKIKKEPEWMTEKRLAGYRVFTSKPLPKWGPDLSGIDFNDVYYYLKPSDKPKADAWDKVPEEIKRTFDKLGIPEAERKFFAGAEIQYDSEVVYGKVRKDLEKQGVIFTDMDNAIKKYPEMVKKYFGTVIPPTDNKFAALNTAVFSGGSFIYVPKGVKVALPLQAYFRINAEKAGQFERTLIIADEGADVTYIEGCLPAEELVSKGDSFQMIGSIKKGDKVATHTGKIQKVNKKFVHKHNGIMFEIVPQSKGNGFRLTGEHPVLCIKRNRVLTKRKQRINWNPEVSTKALLEQNPEFVKAENLEEGDFIVYVAPTSIEDDPTFGPIELKILGLYLAEGSITSNKALGGIRNIAFSFGKSKKEEALANEVNSLIHKKGWKSTTCRTKGGYYVVSSYAKDLIELCETNCGKGAKTKLLSQKLMMLPPLKQKLLIDYYWKGDGNIYLRYGKKLMRASTASKFLSYQIQEIMARNGVFANLNVRPGSEDVILGRKIVRSDQYIIEYTDERKMGEVRRKNNCFYVPIKQIKKHQFNDFVYNFGVDKDESYLVKGFAVHNCTAPIYMSSSLHAAVVELVAHKDAHIRYVTIQNWSKNVYNLVTQRAFVYRDACVEWIDGNIGSRINMKYPSTYLKEEGAKGEILSVAVAGDGQIQDSGGKVYHLAPNTSSKIISKSISKGTGVASYRGLLYVGKEAANAKSTVRCDALLLDEKSKTNTYPYMQVYREDANITHEASVGKIGEEQLFYLMSRGMSEEDAIATIVLGFIDSFAKTLPLEYSLELKRLIKLDTSNSVG
ncbi:MAG: SufD family Fe-S cluster assembly protein [Candidatus Marsarchaeota archaeon]|nr:SufD family Fe-S cluster assembly protein [Candidatus Marsarchaeota archaeon]